MLKITQPQKENHVARGQPYNEHLEEPVEDLVVRVGAPRGVGVVPLPMEESVPARRPAVVSLARLARGIPGARF